MPRSTVLVALSLTLFPALPARAQQPAAVAPPVAPGRGRETGIEIDFRIGYGLPAGQAAAEPRGALSDRFTGVVPLIFGLGYRVHPRVSIGGFFEHGISFLNDGPDGWANPCSHQGFRCSSTVVRWGGDLRFRLMPDRRVDPWLGVGAGYEKWWSDSTFPDNGTSFSWAGSTNQNHWEGSGWEYVHLEVGADYRLVRGLAIGAFATATVAHYSHEAVIQSVPGQRSPSGGEFDIPDRYTHEWILFGVKLSYLWVL